jgi:hypothetical protein
LRAAARAEKSVADAVSRRARARAAPVIRARYMTALASRFLPSASVRAQSAAAVTFSSPSVSSLAVENATAFRYAG